MKSGVVCSIFFLTVSHTSAAELSHELLDRVSNDPHVISATENRERIAGDPYRPLYHISAPKELIHDPNGLCQWKGRYHLFYQYRSPEPGWIIHWGHAYSDDLIHWKDLPIAIKPSLEESCFSGQTYVDEDRVIAMYHGTKAGNIVATADDELLLNWEKHPDNPVIPMHKEGDPYRVFDPCIWKEANGYYYCLTGSYKDG
jgi:beta-fructofuranosidase